MFFLKEIVKNQEQQLAKFIENNSNERICSLFKGYLSQLMNALELLEKKTDPTLVMNSFKDAFSKLFQVTDLLQKNHIDLQEFNENLKKFKSNKKEGSIAIKEFLQKFNKVFEALRRAYFLIEKNGIKDEYFEALRIGLNGLLPSQICQLEKFIKTGEIKMTK
ncbi:hypothetical protein LCGC14_1120640, partial [marine sediment metagenome]